MWNGKEAAGFLLNDKDKQVWKVKEAAGLSEQEGRVLTYARLKTSHSNKRTTHKCILEHIRSVRKLLTAAEEMPMFPNNRAIAAFVSSLELDKAEDFVIDNVAEVIAGLQEDKEVKYDYYKT